MRRKSVMTDHGAFCFISPLNVSRFLIRSTVRENWVMATSEQS